MSDAILSLGEVLVEVMRAERGVPLDTPGTFRGPYASGAPAIFAGAAARLGGPVRFAGVRGDDAFGALCERHMTDAKIDLSGLSVTGEATTGTAFVGYGHDDSREFLFHLRASAAARLAPEHLDPAWFEGVGWLHVTGSSLGVSASVRDACIHAAREAKARGATVSFDPNLRFEFMDAAEIAELCAPILAHADVVLPSRSEAAALTGLPDEAAACRSLLAGGADTVVLKSGPEGCTVFTREGARHVPSIAVTEVDPTGAGDCFAAAFAAARLEGRPPADAARFANAAGALSTTSFGPMEGPPTRGEVEARLRD